MRQASTGLRRSGAGRAWALGGFLVLMLVWVSAAAAAALPAPRRLWPGPDASQHPSVPGKDYRIEPVQARDAAGAVIGVPAYALDVYLGAPDLGWDSVKLAKLPVVPGTIPAALRNRISLVYSADRGWLAVPRGWRPYRVADGMDGTSALLYSAPGGFGHGWLALEVIPVCQGCVWGQTNGFIPAAYKLVGLKDGFLKVDPPVHGLRPKPLSLRHPTPCTAELRYRIPGSAMTIHQTVQLMITGDAPPASRSIHIAMPRGDGALAHYLARQFFTLTPLPHSCMLARDATSATARAAPR